MIVLIFMSTCTLISDLPHLQQDHPLRQFNEAINVVFAIIFSVEALMKAISCGFLLPLRPKRSRLDLDLEEALPPEWHFLTKPYLHDPWNFLDFFIVCISLLSLFNLPGIESLRALRALRPLRLVSRFEDLKITVDALLMSIPAISSLMAVAALFFLIFAILGLELFGGKFGYCSDPLFEHEPYGSRVIPGVHLPDPRSRARIADRLISDYAECLQLPRYNLTRRTSDGILLMDMADVDPGAMPPWLEFVEFPQWMYPQFGTFDNLGNSLMILFELSGLEGWPNVMHWAMDADSDHLFVVPWRISSDEDAGLGGVGAPMETHSTNAFVAGAFCLIWIVIGCFVVVNLTVGVVVDQFATSKRQNEGIFLMSGEAADWVRTQKELLTLRPFVHSRAPKAAWRRRLYTIVNTTRFELFVMAIIILNMLQMCIDFWEPAVNAPYITQMKSAMAILDYCFVGTYTVEMLIKWAGLTVAGYFRDRWNVFDFLLITFAYVEIVVVAGASGSIPIQPTMIRMLRLLRVVRLMRIVRSAKGMRTIMLTVWISIPQLKNIIVLILMIIIITDMVCVNLFFKVNYTVGNFDVFEKYMNTSTSYERGERYFRDDYHYSDDSNWGDTYNRHANFAFFWTGFLTLIRSSTGESFNSIMHDLSGFDWGHNRLTCCSQCGPIIDGNGPDQPSLIIPSTNLSVPLRVVPESSCGPPMISFCIYFLFQSALGLGLRLRSPSASTSPSRVR